MRRIVSPSAALRLALPATVVACWLGLAGAASAQSGKVSGTVTDASNGNEPMIGVVVQLEGTDFGAVTDLDGNYNIIGVRPGTYTVVGTFAGYQPARVTGVRVSIDLTSRIDFAMREGAQADEVVVTGIGEAPLVQRDVTATTAVVGAAEIAALPVENVGDIVALQAGVVNGHFRGGRTGEVGYWVDGMPVTDVFNGGVGVSVENASVQELQVVTGAFNAEYGQALSGIVNIVTKDGSNTYAGSLSSFLGDYASGSTAYFPGIDNVSPTAVRNVEGSLSGPVVKDRVWFFANGRYFGNDGFLRGRRVYTFEDVGFDPTGRLALLNPGGSGDSAEVAFNPYDKVSGQLKLTARLNRSMRVAASAIASRENSRNGSYSLLYLPDNRSRGTGEALSTYLKFTHTLTSKTFYEVGVTRNTNTYRSRLFDDPLDPRYIDNEVSGFGDYLLTAGFRAGGTDNGRFSRNTTTWLAKADVTSQVNRTNLVKMGVEVRRHTLRFNDDYTVVSNATDTAFVATNGRYTYHPVEASAYVQDKIEAGGLIVNVGVRADYFNANGVVFKDPTDPNAVFLERRFAGQTGPLDYTPDTYFAATSGKFQVSPRLGVAFPITESGVVHFSYGMFFQTPIFERLYQNPYFQLGSSGSGLIGLIGNADLDPEQTISGELGLKQGIGETAAVEVTAYYRDIRNLAGTATDPILINGTSARYGRYQNSDFGFVRGVILRYDQRFGRYAFLGADYTYQVARANASDPSQSYNAAAARGERETKIVPTSWDQRHTGNLSFGFNKPGDWGFGAVARFGSGEPYTPSQTTLQTGVILPTVTPLNSQTKPFVYTVDVDASKTVRLAGLNGSLFARVSNLLDRRNEYGVNAETGTARYSLQQQVDARTFRGNPALLTQWYQNPYFYGEPRRVTLGLSVNF